MSVIDRVGAANSNTPNVFVSGYFNVLHPGHYRLLKFAAGLGNTLTVGVLSDKLVTDATVNEKERLDAVSSLEFVDSAVLLDSDPSKHIIEHKPEIVVKGWEFKDSFNSEMAAVAKYGGKLVFGSGDIKLTREELVVSMGRESLPSTIKSPKTFVRRRKIDLEKIRNIIGKFSTLKVAVIGDIIVDNYVTCDPVGMSREDPTIVVRPVNEQKFLGGAGIVAAHARGLGANVHFFSICGNDDPGDFAKMQSQEYSVSTSFLKDQTRPTIEKTRFRANGKTLLRVNNYKDRPISNDLQEKLMRDFSVVSKNLDLVIFSDFSYGMLPQNLVEKLVKIAKSYDVMITADSQSSSQIGDITRFKDVSLITPTEHEARLGLQNYEDGLAKVAGRLIDLVRTQHVFITLSSDGVLVHTQDQDSVGLETVTDRLPALQMKPVDPAGAGDALLVAASMSLAVGASIWESALIGSLAAAIQVGRIGNIPLTDSEILNEIRGGDFLDESTAFGRRAGDAAYAPDKVHP